MASRAYSTFSVSPKSFHFFRVGSAEHPNVNLEQAESNFSWACHDFRLTGDERRGNEDDTEDDDEQDDDETLV